MSVELHRLAGPLKDALPTELQRSATHFKDIYFPIVAFELLMTISRCHDEFKINVTDQAVFLELPFFGKTLSSKEFCIAVDADLQVRPEICKFSESQYKFE